MERIQLKALGKINLGLDVLGKRENGYHDVRMIMQTVYLYDEVTLEKRQEPGITVSTNLIYLPTDKTNIAYRAAKILLDEFGERRGVAIHLKKHIPVAAGMAGGSADAAAVLFGMNRMFGWKLSEKELMERGVTLGADVPYCIMRGTALAEGIGEKLTRLPAMPKCHLLIAKPPISVSTKLVYEKLDALAIVDHPDIDGIIEGGRIHGKCPTECDRDRVSGDYTDQGENDQRRSHQCDDERKRSDRIWSFQRAKYGKEDGGTDSTVGTCKTDLHDNHSQCTKEQEER